MLFLAILIRLESPGNPLFLQRRIGMDRKPFICFKLRTMWVGTPHVATHDIPKSAITRLGRILRAIKLDELPQLLNIIWGDMDFVGPRPCLESQNELIKEREKRNVFSVKPGMTGIAQVQGIDMSTPALLAETDAQYIAMCSFKDDLILLLKTLRVGCRPSKLVS